MQLTWYALSLSNWNTCMVAKSFTKLIYYWGIVQSEGFDVTNTVSLLLTGVLLYYILTQNYIWWFFIIVAYFWGIMFPLHYRRYKEANKIQYIHTAMFLLGVLLPIVPAVGALKHGFTAIGIVLHPPVICSLNSDDNFLVLLLPLTILFTIGLCMLLVVFWKLAKVWLNQVNR